MNKLTNYNAFRQEASCFISHDRLYADELRRLAWGTDAGFYRLTPQLVIRSRSEEEVARLLLLANKYRLPVTFRAAGTSLSGQAISNSILIVAGKHWEEYHISPDGTEIRMQPGLVGQRVNELLAPYGRKFSPDPASIKSAMVGGIVMNNASGMNCGTHANSDRVLISARIVLADGTVLDTGDVHSRMAFAESHPQFIARLVELRDQIRANAPLAERIQTKYAIKNVTGLNLLPFLIYDDPFDLIVHLLVGSEGTLAFLSEVTMHTEHDYPCKASAMLYFRTLQEACRAVVLLKPLTNAQGESRVKGAELLDWKSLSSVDDATFVRFATEQRAQGNSPQGLTALLTETKGDTPKELQENIAAITAALTGFDTYTPIHFTDCANEYAAYWATRSGIFPSVGGTRPPGTTCLIEDVAFPMAHLPEATAELQQLLARHGYHDACIYGHALEGNYHFIINQSFGTADEVARYEGLMDEVKRLVVDKYDGSLKAEHGTGRNMAPFVRHEWGEEAFAVMQSVKQLFDPHGLLNPGVIFNDDPHCHLRHFKPLPRLPIQEDSPAARTNKCIECGFCEVNCVACGFTLSPRQRIVIRREIARLTESGEQPERLALLQKQYSYLGNQTCAGDGLCSLSCPMGINTAHLTHLLRGEELPKGSLGYALGSYTARHFGAVKGMLRPVLSLANGVHSLMGTPAMSLLAQGMHRMGLPLWTPAMPKDFQVRRVISTGLTARPSLYNSKPRALPWAGFRWAFSPKKNGNEQFPPGEDSSLLRAFSLKENGNEQPTSCEDGSLLRAESPMDTSPGQRPGFMGQSEQRPERAVEEKGMEMAPNILKVVYFPSCINQTMGLPRESAVALPLVNAMLSLLQKAGCEVIFPANMENLCCGTIWESKGMLDIAHRKTEELEAALYLASEGGKYPILCDQSPCLHRMRETMKGLKLYEPAEFIYTFLRDRLIFSPTNRPVALHITCSTKRMGLAHILIALAKLCTTRLFVPEEVGCCGFAGDKGFTHPELNGYALRKLRPQIEERNIQIGYCNSRTCEIGLATHAGIPYVSIVYLVDQCTQGINTQNIQSL